MAKILQSMMATILQSKCNDSSSFRLRKKKPYVTSAESPCVANWNLELNLCSVQKKTANHRSSVVLWPCVLGLYMSLIAFLF